MLIYSNKLNDAFNNKTLKQNLNIYITWPNMHLTLKQHKTFKFNPFFWHRSFKVMRIRKSCIKTFIFNFMQKPKTNISNFVFLSSTFFFCVLFCHDIFISLPFNSRKYKLNENLGVFPCLSFFVVAVVVLWWN